MFVEAVERGEHFIVNFAIGSHPLDFLAAGVRPPADEFVRVATVRGAPLAMVPAVSNGQLVPADAELIIEGCFDKAGYTEIEGPYGEFLGYYGPPHIDPVFHVTTITHRKDVLHQTVLHGTRHMARCDHSHQRSVITESRIWRVLGEAGITPIAVYAQPSGTPACARLPAAQPWRAGTHCHCGAARDPAPQARLRVRRGHRRMRLKQFLERCRSRSAFISSRGSLQYLCSSAQGEYQEDALL